MDETNLVAEEVRRRIHEGTDARYCEIEVDAAPAASEETAPDRVAANE